MGWVKPWIIILHCSVLVSIAYSQGSSFGNTTSTCASKTTCGECIQSPDCIWCSQPEFNNLAGLPLDRCNTRTVHQAHPESIRCGVNYLLSPTNEFYLIRDDEITKGSEYRETVQIRPQNVTIRLRVGQAYDLNVQYEQAEDYPVDLYYLMDLSKSMEDDKATLSSLGTQLANTMGALTSNFRLGFGSFVDKVVMPYVSTVEKNLRQPCPNCEPVYGYQNIMRLDDNTARFAGEVERARVSGNLDAPEGGFDAIMQAIVCEDEIGWRRNNTRKLLVFSTDASFHYAGDGKLGGIVRPNDGICHMDARGEYTHSTLLDYPSVAQINAKVKEKSINMIFAVTAEQVNIYQRLSQQIQGSTCGELSANSSNVVELVKNEYEKITSEVKLYDTSSGVVRVSYFSKCLDHEMKETNKCGGLKVGQTVTFVAKIEITECPKNPADWKQTFDISVVGLEEKLTVNLDMICQCPCEIPGNEGYVYNSPYCKYAGIAQCGACVCDEFHFGRNCECDIRKGAFQDDDRGCKMDNTTDLICQGRGQCICGECVCNKRSEQEQITGPFCECDNFSCEREGGELCSGPDHGKCDCGKCKCEVGWTGDNCGCSTSTEGCYAPGKTGERDICSGKGECVCNQCRCNSTETERYSGRYCEKCPTCPDRCDELAQCVQCTVHKTGEYEDEDDCNDLCRERYPIIEEVDVATSDENLDEKYCFSTDATDKCRFYYVYGYDIMGKLYIKAQKTKDCPPDPPIFWIIFGVVGAIVFVGIAFLLAWKCATHIADRREYASFEKERMNAKWDAGENPIYRQATSTFRNPLYAGR